MQRKEAEIQGVHAHLKNFFQLTDLGDMSYFLGPEIKQKMAIIVYRLKDTLRDLRKSLVYKMTKEQKLLWKPGSSNFDNQSY